MVKDEGVPMLVPNELVQVRINPNDANPFIESFHKVGTSSDLSLPPVAVCDMLNCERW